MGTIIKITERSSKQSNSDAVADTVLKLSTFGFAGLPVSGKKFDAEVNGRYVGTFSSKEEAWNVANEKAVKAASKK
jgi:hypothetical protein